MINIKTCAQPYHITNLSFGYLYGNLIHTVKNRVLWWYPTFATYLIGCCHDTHGYKGVLLGYLSGVLHILTTPLGCCWTTPQGCCTYSVTCTLGVLLDYLSGHAHWLHPWSAVGLPLRGVALATLGVLLDYLWGMLHMLTTPTAPLCSHGYHDNTLSSRLQKWGITRAPYF